LKGGENYGNDEEESGGYQENRGEAEGFKRRLLQDRQIISHVGLRGFQRFAGREQMGSLPPVFWVV